VTPCCPDGCTLSFQNLLDTGGRPDASLDRLDGSRDPTFVELETSQNLPGTLR
jgi:hypothetical protein